MSEHILTELASGVLRIEMRRPEKKNALTGPMYAAMADAIERAAREDATLPAASLRETKRLLKQSIAALVPQVMQAEGEIFTRQLASPEAREAFSAFLEKRKPDFSKFS